MGVLSLIDLYRIGLSDEPFQGSDPPTQEEMVAVHLLRSMRAFQPVESYHSRQKRKDAEREVEEIQTNLVRIAEDSAGQNVLTQCRDHTKTVNHIGFTVFYFLLFLAIRSPSFLSNLFGKCSTEKPCGLMIFVR